MNYLDAKRCADLLSIDASKAGEVLNQFPRNAMGLVSDSVRTSAEYVAAKKVFERAFQESRSFNAWYTKKFRKEIIATRRDRFAA